MKVVLLHDWLTGFRGGERLLEQMLELYPDAPLYTLVYVPGTTSKIIESRKIVTSCLNNVPRIEDNYRKFLPLMPLVVDSMKITEDVDVMISSSHCVIKGVKKPKGSKHICYINSPMRYIYDQFDVYFGPDSPLLYQVAARLMRPYLQTWDYISNTNVDLFIANSNFIKRRIELFYHRDSVVLHPFVDLKDFRENQKNPPKKEDYYLMVSAFAPNKRVDLAVAAFNELGKELRIVGSGQLEKKLKSFAKPNIKFLGSLPRQEIVELMGKARGFIFPGIEDFGITPLESLASGTPVVAYKAGGVLETLDDSVALFFENQDVQSLKRAVIELEKKSFDVNKLYARAENFSREIFKSKFDTIVRDFIL